MTPAEIAKLIDHALLHPTLTDQEMQSGCLLAAGYKTASVCIKPFAVNKAKQWLKDTGVMVTTVIGFPHGSNSISQKYSESVQAITDGAVELDMVVNIGKVLSDDWDYITKEIKTILQLATGKEVTLKVIFETDFITDRHKIELCRICSELKVPYVKTSTGFGFVKQSDGRFQTTGATADDIKLMRKYCGPHVAIKASGGIKTLDDLLQMVECGATRIGTGSTLQILEQASRSIGSESVDKGKENKNEY